MSTTGLVMTVTDELLAELEEAAGNATPGPWNYDGSYVCTTRQEGGTVYVESWNPVADALLSKNAKYIAAANPATITALTAELRRLRAENAELAQSLAESRANDRAAMGWLTSLRWASGDRGERMLPELVSHIEGLAKDAGRYRWLCASAWYVGPEPRGDTEAVSWNDHNETKSGVTQAIDTAMATK